MNAIKHIALGVVAFASVLLLTFLAQASKTTRTYKLPNGNVVRCSYFEETNKGNYVLKDCDDGVEYYTNGTIEVVQ